MSHLVKNAFETRRFSGAVCALTVFLVLCLGTSLVHVRAAAPVTERGSEAQLSQMLEVARQCATRCANAMERWIATGQVTEARLFSRLYYPIPSTDPAKFSTDYDKLADRDIQPIEEAALANSPDIAFVVLVDVNGYLPTHNLRFSQPLTGDLEKDLTGNRTKRIFSDKTGLAAARNTSSYLFQSYERDTGETMADLSVPVYVNGKHWGAVRVGYRVTNQ